MSTEISEKAKISALSTLNNYFLGEAVKYFADKSSTSSALAKQLTLSAVLAADTAIENSAGATWNNVDIKKFGADIFRLIGLGIDFANKEAYVVPYRNPKTGKYDLTTPVSADGLVKLAKMYSIRPIKDFQKYAVREGDIVNVEYGENKSWHYKPILFNSAKVIGYLTVIVFEDGDFDAMITTLEEIEARRKASKAPDSPAWTKWPVEMGLAKATRKHIKRFAINIPSDLDDEDFTPITKDMGEVSEKIPIDYPTLAAKPEEEIEKELDNVSLEGTPFEG